MQARRRIHPGLTALRRGQQPHGPLSLASTPPGARPVTLCAVARRPTATHRQHLSAPECNREPQPPRHPPGVYNHHHSSAGSSRSRLRESNPRPTHYELTAMPFVGIRRSSPFQVSGRLRCLAMTGEGCEPPRGLQPPGPLSKLVHHRHAHLHAAATTRAASAAETVRRVCAASASYHRSSEGNCVNSHGAGGLPAGPRRT